LLSRADTYRRRKDYAAADADYRRILENQQLLYALVNYSELLSTCPDDKIRDGAKALKLINQAVSINDYYSRSVVMAAALAETGKFDEALKVLDAVLADKTNAGFIDPELIGRQRKAYLNKMAWRSE
jgi:tetratricopeptide (TPR) repeat protein